MFVHIYVVCSVVVKIYGGTIDMESILLGEKMGIIYIVEKIFITVEEIDQASKQCNAEGCSTDINLWIPSNTHDTIVIEIVNYIISTLHEVNSHTFKLVKIVTVEIQIVFGVNYRITLDVSTDDGNGNSVIMRCEVVVFDQLWTKTREVISTKCFPVQQPTTTTTTTTTTLAPIVTVPPHHVTTLRPQPIFDDTYITTIIEYVISILQSREDTFLTIIKIIKSEWELVSDGVHKIIMVVEMKNSVDSTIHTCNIVVLDKWGINIRELVNSKCSPDVTTAKPSPGGFMIIDIELDDAREIANFAIENLPSSKNEDVMLIEIIRAERRVADGTDYKLLLEVASLVERIKFKSLLKCEVAVYDQSWSSTRQLKEANCSPMESTIEHIKQVKKRIEMIGISGGFREAEIDGDDIKEMAEFAASSLSSSINFVGSIRLVKIIKAQTQDVVGVVYDLIIQVATVINGADSGLFVCEINVFEKKSTKTRRLSKSKCTPISGNSDIDVVTPEKPPLNIIPSYDDLLPTLVEGEDVKVITTFVMFSLIRKMGILNLVNIIKAEKRQVENEAESYKLILELLKKSDSSVQTCEVIVDGQWKNQMLQLTHLLCSAKKYPQPVDPIPGEYGHADVNDDTVKGMAEFAATMLSSRENMGTLTVTKIVKAETQVADGTNYRMTLELTSDSDSTVQTCEVVVNLPKLTKLLGLSQSKCSSSPEVIDVIPPETGDFIPVDVNDSGIKELAKFATRQLFSVENRGILFLKKIVKAEKQVAAGTNYRMTLELTAERDFTIRTCQVVVFDQPRIKTRILSQSKCSSSKIIDKIPPGVFIPADINSNSIKELAEFAVTTLSSVENKGSLTLTEIVKAEMQVAAGTNYRMTLKLTAESDSAIQTCEVVVFDQPRTKTRLLSQSKCSSSHIIDEVENLDGADSSSSTNGGFSSAKSDAVDVKEMAKFAVKSLSSSQKMGTLTLVKIVKAEMQIVAGKNYKMTLELAKKGDTSKITCEVVVFNQVSTKTRRLTKSSCSSKSITIEAKPTRNKKQGNKHN